MQGADERETLAATVRRGLECARADEQGEMYLLEQAFRSRLAALGIDPTPDLACALMAIARLLAESTPEWGGDARDVLCEVAAIGLALLDEDAGPEGGV